MANYNDGSSRDEISLLQFACHGFDRNFVNLSALISRLVILFHLDLSWLAGGCLAKLEWTILSLIGCSAG